jgi:Uncharacterized protein conserved in bacteria
MSYQTILANLYFLLIHADGNVNEKEAQQADKIIRLENFDGHAFRAQFELLKSSDQTSIYTNSILHLKKLKADQQIRCAAWLCVVANVDGFMDKSEWMFIYKIYSKELNLKLEDIMKVQKEIMLSANRLHETA